MAAAQAEPARHPRDRDRRPRREERGGDLLRLVPRRRPLRPPLPGVRLAAPPPRGVPDVVHAVPARGLAGDAHGDLGVPVARRAPDRDGRRERLDVRGGLRLRRGGPDGRAADEEEEEKPSRITRRKKATPKKEEPKEKAPEEEVEEEENPAKSSIRMPRKGAAKKSAKKEEPKTYYFYNEEDDFYYKKDVNEPEDDNDILVDEEEYLDAMCPILEEDFFYQLDGKAYKLAAGERLPEEYDEETWEPITEEKFEEMTAEPKKTSVRASRKKPTPSRRPRK